MKEDQAASILRRMVSTFETGAIDDVESYVASNYLDHQGLGSRRSRPCWLPPSGSRTTPVHGRGMFFGSGNRFEIWRPLVHGYLF
jgi:hypothetical protein